MTTRTTSAVSIQGPPSIVSRPASGSVQNEVRPSLRDAIDNPLSQRNSFQYERQSLPANANDQQRSLDVQAELRDSVTRATNGGGDGHKPGSEVTWRALILGAVMGTVFGAQNIYFGLKTGSSFGSTITCALIGFGALKALSPDGIVNVHEVNVMQTAGVAGTSMIFAGGFSTYVSPVMSRHRARCGLSPLHCVRLWLRRHTPAQSTDDTERGS